MYVYVPSVETKASVTNNRIAVSLRRCIIRTQDQIL